MSLMRCYNEAKRSRQEENSLASERKVADGSWMDISLDEAVDAEKMSQQFGLPKDILAYALDRDERARISYHPKEETYSIIYNVVKQTKGRSHYETTPMMFVLQKNRLLTLTHQENQYLVAAMDKLVQDNPTQTLPDLLLASLFMITDYYFPKIEDMRRERNRINTQLREKTTKQKLFELSDLETGVVYFIDATKQNVIVLEQLRETEVFHTLHGHSRQQLKETLIEARQAAEMTQLDAQILQQLSGTYNNILNNNLNDTMRILTVLSILLTVPTIVTGFFGMNMPLPLGKRIFDWVLTILISAIGWFGLSAILKKILK